MDDTTREALELLVAVSTGDWKALMNYLHEDAQRNAVAAGILHAKEAMGLPPTGRFVITSPHVPQVAKTAWAMLHPDLAQKIATEAPEAAQEVSTND